MLVKKLLYNMTTKTVHDILTKSEWKDISVQKAAWSVRKYAEKLGYSEQWITDFVYTSCFWRKRIRRRNSKRTRKHDHRAASARFLPPGEYEIADAGEFPASKSSLEHGFLLPEYPE